MQEAVPEVILILTTCSSLLEGETIAKHLLAQKLVACATLGSHLHSYYVWKGQEHDATEYPLQFKTLRDRYPAVEAEIRRLHSYENPEILAVPVAAASVAYRHWIAESLGARSAE